MLRILFSLLTAVAAFGADDPWAAVRALESGIELRVYRVNEKSPLAAKFDRASHESLVVTTKSGQESISKESIERIDCRRGRTHRTGTRVERNIEPRGSELSGAAIPGATTSVKTGISIPTLPGFKKVYERASAAR